MIFADLEVKINTKNGNEILLLKRAPENDYDKTVLVIGVDLNRNFPAKNWQKTEVNEYFGGTEPASEDETRFLVYVIEKYKPDLIITLHEPYAVVNYDGPAEGIASRISQITGYKVEESIGYPTPGSFGTYCGIERNIPVITLELPEHTNNAKDKNALWNKTKGIFDYIALEF